MVFGLLQMKTVEVNKDLLKLRAHNFLVQTGLIPITLFGSITARQLGYSATTVGSLFSALPLATVLVKPPLCSIADKFQLRQTIFIISLVGILLANLFMIILPPRQIEAANVIFGCNNNNSNGGSIIVISVNERRTPPDPKRFINENVNCQLHCFGIGSIKQILCTELRLQEFCTQESDVSMNQFIDFDCIVSPNLHQNGNFVYSEVTKASVIRPNNKNNNANKWFTFERCKENEMFELNCKMECDEIVMTEAFNDPVANSVILSCPFWCLLLTLMLHWISVTVNLSITDTICFDLLGKDDHKYGTVRVWGTIGYGLSGGLCGLLADQLSQNGKRKNYNSLYLFAIAVFALDILVCFFITIKQEIRPTTMLKGITKLFRNVRTIVFILACIYVAMTLNVMWLFLFWYLEDISTVEELKWSRTIQGLDGLVNAVFSEVPIMFVAGRVIRKYGFPITTSTIFLALAFRFTLYGLLVRPVWVLPIELTSGFCYGMMLVVMTTYANEIAPAGLEATTQSLFSVCFDGIGTSLGGLVGGIIFDSYGGRKTFFIYAATSLVVFVLFGMTQFLISVITKSKKKTSHECARSRYGSLINNNNKI